MNDKSNSVSPADLGEFFNLDSSYSDRWHCTFKTGDMGDLVITLKPGSSLSSILSNVSDAYRREEAYNSKMEGFMDRIIQQIRIDVPLILKEGYASELSATDFYHAHVIISPKEGHNKIFILYHTHEFENRSSRNSYKNKT